MPFEHDHCVSNLELGKRNVEESLSILQNRNPQCNGLRILPLMDRQATGLMQRAFRFLEANNSGQFEKDNLAHVKRLMANIGKHAAMLKKYLDIPYKHVQLLAVIHDLGKSQVPDSMYRYLQSIYGQRDFLALRVMPHELYSMYWVNQLGMEIGLSEEKIHVLMDQIANHNFGLNVSDPEIRHQLGISKYGQPDHWWLSQWQNWAQKGNAKGLKVSSSYGHTVAPLASTLVLFDRIDGGDLRSWEKYYHQDLISGLPEKNPPAQIRGMHHMTQAGRKQVRAIGFQLRRDFVSPELGLEGFGPYSAAMKMFEYNDKVLSAAQETPAKKRAEYR